MGNGVFQFLSAKRKTGWMAILPQGGTMTLAYVVRRHGQRPEVCMLDTFAVERSEREALQRLKQVRQLKSYACTTLLGLGECNITQMDAPAVPKEERREALRWAIRDVVDYPVDRACIDVLDIPNDGLPPGRSAGVLVVSAPDDAVLAKVAVFEDSKVGLDAVDIPELAQRNIAALFEDDNRGLAFLRIDESGMMLTLTFKGELITVRRAEITSAQLSDGSEEQRLRVRERLVLELQRSLDNFDRQYGHLPISKIVFSCCPEIDGLVAELSANAYVPLVEMDLSSVMDFPSVPELKHRQHQARNLLAIGAALRTGEDAS